MKCEELEHRFDLGEDITPYLEMAGARRPGQSVKRVNVDFPVWMIASLDKEARRLGVPRHRSSRCGSPSGGTGRLSVHVEGVEPGPPGEAYPDTKGAGGQRRPAAPGEALLES